MFVLFEILISLFERAYLLAYEPNMSANSYAVGTHGMTICGNGARGMISGLLPKLLQGEDRDFAKYITNLAKSRAKLAHLPD